MQTPGTPKRALAQEIFNHAVSAFGVSRCMVASNWPVDLVMGKQSLPDLYNGIYELVEAGGSSISNSSSSSSSSSSGAAAGAGGAGGGSSTAFTAADKDAFFYGNAWRVYGMGSL